VEDFTSQFFVEVEQASAKILATLAAAGLPIIYQE